MPDFPPFLKVYFFKKCSFIFYFFSREESKVKRKNSAEYKPSLIAGMDPICICICRNKPEIPPKQGTEDWMSNRYIYLLLYFFILTLFYWPHDMVFFYIKRFTLSNTLLDLIVLWGFFFTSDLYWIQTYLDKEDSKMGGKKNSEFLCNHIVLNFC